MFETIFGLPVHPLVIHGIVVLMPLAALSVLAAAFVPRFRRWAGPLPLILSVAATALVPVATQSGDWLAQAIKAMQNPAVGTHASLGRLMLWWGLGLVVAAALLYGVEWKAKRDTKFKPSLAITVGVAVIAAVASVGALVHVVRVGDSGTRAVWEGQIPEQ